MLRLKVFWGVYFESSSQDKVCLSGASLGDRGDSSSRALGLSRDLNSLVLVDDRWRKGLLTSQLQQEALQMHDAIELEVLIRNRYLHCNWSRIDK